MTALHVCAQSLTCLKQIFQIHDDSSHSTAFPLSVHFNNLRGIVATAHMEEAVAIAWHEISVSKRYPVLHFSEYLSILNTEVEQPLI